MFSIFVFGFTNASQKLYICSSFKILNTLAVCITVSFCFDPAVHQWNSYDEGFTESRWIPALTGEVNYGLEWPTNATVWLHVHWQTLNTCSACRYACEIMSWKVFVFWAHTPSPSLAWWDVLLFSPCFQLTFSLSMYCLYVLWRLHTFLHWWIALLA